MEPLKLGTVRDRGTTVCTYGLEGPECDKPAEYHFLWINQDGTSPACEEHKRLVEEERDTSEVPYDLHKFGEHCNHPGAIWVFVDHDGAESMCIPPTMREGFRWSNHINGSTDNPNEKDT